MATDPPYWSLQVKAVLEKLATSETGLSSGEAANRLARNGPNKLVLAKQDALVVRYLKQLLNPLILLLLVASVISAATGELTSFFIIFAIILISSLLDFFQEYKAEQATEKLRERVSLTTTVLRDGKQQTIAATALVPGDVLVLAPGNKVPADCRLLTANELQADESSLTGESTPVEKEPNTTMDQHAALPDRRNCVFMATHIISGNATAVVVAIGNATEFGAIAKSVSEKPPEHAFEHGLKHFGFLIMKFTLFLVLIVFFINAFFKHDILNSFIFALALAVGLTPELLPIILTLNLSRGALRMAKKGVIVKHLPAIQDFGSMELLCTDKTGTLTENHIILERYEDAEGNETSSVFNYGYINSHFISSLKTPLEKAVLTHEHKTIHDYKKIAEIPFDFNRRASSVIVKHGSDMMLITKGATDLILANATAYELDGKNHKLTGGEKEKFTHRFEELSKQGFRVLALAKKQTVQKAQYTPADETALTFLGFMAFFDPPKKTAKQAIQLLSDLGVQMKVITGDNELVTAKICEELALPVRGTLRGDRIDALPDAALAALAQQTTIFARISPTQKQRIIRVLKRSGAVVGYLGDGINDAPSLKTADIGISVNNAVDIAKDTASLILLHNDLHVLKDGVLEGRKTYANIMKYIMMAASSNFGNMFSVAGASLILPFLPMLPVQILLNNLLYDISQLAIPTDNVDVESLKSPRSWDVGFIKQFMIIFGPISSIFDFATFYVLLHILRVGQSAFQTGWFIESLISQALIILSIRTARSPFFKSIPSRLMLASTGCLIILVLLLPYSPIAQLFGFTPPPVVFYACLAGILALYILLAELVKRWFYRQAYQQAIAKRHLRHTHKLASIRV